MKKTLFAALLVIGAGLASAKADVAFSVSFGTYHYTPRHCYVPPAPVYYPPPVVTYAEPVYAEPVYTTPVYTAPVYTSPVYTAPVYVTPSCPPPALVVPGYRTGPSIHVGVGSFDQPKYGHHYGGHGHVRHYPRHYFQSGHGYKH